MALQLFDTETLVTHIFDAATLALQFFGTETLALQVFSTEKSGYLTLLHGDTDPPSLLCTEKTLQLRYGATDRPTFRYKDTGLPTIRY